MKQKTADLTSRTENLLAVCDLTRNLDGVIRTYGHDTTILLRNTTTKDNLQVMSELRVSPHVGTHIDLPYCMTHLLGDRWLEYFRDGIEDANDQEWEIPCLLSMDCILIDISKKYTQVMYNALKDIGISIEELPEQPTYIWKSGQLESILKKLRVAKDNIKWIDRYQNHLVVFHTGWRQFAPSYADLQDTSWMPWHPFLLHPYLDYDAVDYLLQDKDGAKAKGIGCDIYGLDTPLRHLFTTRRMQGFMVNDVKKIIENRRECPSEHLQSNAAYWPLHGIALSNKNWVLEQLYIPPEIFVHSSAKSNSSMKYIRGRIVIMPYLFSKSRDVLLVSVLFHPQGD